MKITVSTNRAEEIIDAFADHKTEGITLDEALQISFLTMISRDALHLERKVMYGGNLFSMHSCIEEVIPNQPAKSLRKRV